MAPATLGLALSGMARPPAGLTRPIALDSTLRDTACVPLAIITESRGAVKDEESMAWVPTEDEFSRAQYHYLTSPPKDRACRKEFRMAQRSFLDTVLPGQSEVDDYMKLQKKFVTAGKNKKPKHVDEFVDDQDPLHTPPAPIEVVHKDHYWNWHRISQGLAGMTPYPVVEGSQPKIKREFPPSEDASSDTSQPRVSHGSLKQWLLNSSLNLWDLQWGMLKHLGPFGKHKHEEEHKLEEEHWLEERSMQYCRHKCPQPFCLVRGDCHHHHHHDDDDDDDDNYDGDDDGDGDDDDD